jgi:hypothetical protein
LPSSLRPVRPRPVVGLHPAHVHLVGAVVGAVVTRAGSLLLILILIAWTGPRSIGDARAGDPDGRPGDPAGAGEDAPVAGSFPRHQRALDPGHVLVPRLSSVAREPADPARTTPGDCAATAARSVNVTPKVDRAKPLRSTKERPLRGLSSSAATSDVLIHPLTRRGLSFESLQPQQSADSRVPSGARGAAGKAS